MKSIPELLVYGDYDPDARTGPAIWLRCMVDRTLESPALPDDCTPIIYLPGISRQLLRAGEECPAALRPFVELMYRGTLWLQRGGHDWTATAFMTSDNALGLEMSGDNQTTEAFLRALPEFVAEPLTRYQGRPTIIHADTKSVALKPLTQVFAEVIPQTVRKQQASTFGHLDQFGRLASVHRAGPTR